MVIMSQQTLYEYLYKSVLVMPVMISIEFFDYFQSIPIYTFIFSLKIEKIYYKYVFALMCASII